VETPPEFAPLNDRQRRFAIEFVSQGSGNATSAARAAGYRDSGTGNINRRAWELLRHPLVAKAIRAEIEATLGEGAPAAAATLRRIAAEPGHRDAAKASIALLDRTGFAPRLRVEHTVEVTM